MTPPTTKHSGLQKIKDQIIKELQDWNQMKIIACIGIPTMIGLLISVKWLGLVVPILNTMTPNTISESIIYISATFGAVTPLFLLYRWLGSLGSWLGKGLKIYKDRTISITLDDIKYDISKMPEEQKNQIKDILSSCKKRRYDLWGNIIKEKVRLE